MIIPFPSCIFSIEEVKQKKEYERIMKEAEDKKSKKREKLIALRQEFLFLLQKNQELPKHMQLQREVCLLFISHLLLGKLSKMLIPNMLGSKMSSAMG